MQEKIRRKAAGLKKPRPIRLSPLSLNIFHVKAASRNSFLFSSTARPPTQIFDSLNHSQLSCRFRWVVKIIYHFKTIVSRALFTRSAAMTGWWPNDGNMTQVEVLLIDIGTLIVCGTSIIYIFLLRDESTTLVIRLSLRARTMWSSMRSMLAKSDYVQMGAWIWMLVTSCN
jgi:hypothetical protein